MFLPNFVKEHDHLVLTLVAEPLPGNMLYANMLQYSFFLALAPPKNRQGFWPTTQMFACLPPVALLLTMHLKCTGGGGPCEGCAARIRGIIMMETVQKGGWTGHE